MDTESLQPLLSNHSEKAYFTMKKSSSDPMIRDKKALQYSGYSVIPIFTAFLLLVTPLWLFVLVPLTVVFQIFIKLYNLVLGSRLKSSNSVDSSGSILPARKSEPLDRIYDIVVYGATGFTGKMAAVYIAKNYGSTFKWALSGRRKDALEKLRDELTLIDNSLRSLPIIIADSSDESSLETMTSLTKVVLTTAGPFSKYGSDLVKWCAVNGTHYCDITGESDWVREMIDRYDDAARKSGARIVSHCGHDCIPWDLAVLECANKLKTKGESLKEIHFYDEINASASGGTMDTALTIMTSRVVYKSSLGFDPLLKTATGDKSSTKLSVANQFFLGHSAEYQSWVGPFVMAMVMANCVRRSNAINNYGVKVTYKEAQVYPSFMAGYVTLLGFFVLGTALYCPPAKWLLVTYLLPKPGQGPSEKEMDDGFLRVTGVATGSNGGKARAVFYFPTDPGYRDTARMLVEAGLVLALQGNQVKVGGGVWTPAACQGELLTQRLVNTGSTLTVE